MAEQQNHNKEEKLEEAFIRHSKVAEKAKQEYDEAYERLFGNLSASHLEPFAKILLEKEGIVLDTETAMRYIQENMRKHVLVPWNAAWEEHVAGNVTKLEMLKEHFKEHEGKDWRMHEKGVEERTLPLRMEYKQKRLQWLQMQVAHQNQELEKLIEETVKNRILLQHVTEEAVKLNECINKTEIEAKKRELENYFTEMLDHSYQSTQIEEDSSDDLYD